MRSHTMSLRQAKDRLTHVVRDALKGRATLITRDGEDAAVVIPMSTWRALSWRGARKRQRLEAAARRFLRLLREG